MLDKSNISEEAAAEHDRLYSEALNACKNEIPLAEQPNLAAPGWLKAFRLRRAIQLFKRAVQINPQNWNAMWFIGKLQQRLRNWAEALDYFGRATSINTTQPDLAREASLCAMELGRKVEGVKFAQDALNLAPYDAGLIANLALAYLLSGNLSDAQAAIDQALSKDPTDSISMTLATMIQHFEARGRTPPDTSTKLLIYWQRHLNAMRRSSVL